MTRPSGVVRSEGRCPTCGKLRYTTRKRARRVRRNLGLPPRSVFLCGGYYHVGHPSVPRPPDAGDDWCPTPWRPHLTAEQAAAAADEQQQWGRARPTVYQCRCGGGHALARAAATQLTGER